MGDANAATYKLAIVKGDADSALPLLKKVVQRGGHNWAEICRKVDAHHCQIWLAVTDKPIAALVTQATTDDTLECLIAGGTETKLWAKAAEERFMLFALANGLKRLRIFGRKGWQRVFPHWQVTGEEDGLVIMEFAL